MADFRGGRGKKVTYETQMYRIPSPLRPTVERLGTQFRMLWDGLVDPKGEKLISRIEAAIPDPEQLGKLDEIDQISSKERQPILDIKNKEVEEENAKLRSQLDDMAARANEWHDRAKAAEAKLEQLHSQPVVPMVVNPEAITLLLDAIKLKANAGGAIKRKIEQALALLTGANSQ